MEINEGNKSPLEYIQGQEHDDFVLNSAIEDQTSDKMEFAQENIDRSELVDEQTTSDLNSLGLTNVTAYDSGKLESEFIKQADTLFQIQTLNKKPAEEKRQKTNVNLIESTGNSVRIGEHTPFELMIQNQVVLEKQRVAKKSFKKRENPSKEKVAKIGLPQRKRLRIGFTKSVNDCDEMTEEDEKSRGSSSSLEYSPTECSSNSDYDFEESCEELDEDKPSTSCKKQGKKTSSGRSIKDDGNEKHFVARVRKFWAEQELARVNGKEFDDPQDFHKFDNGYRVSNFVWNRMYRYQKTGVRWLLELHNQYVGGILADEMGLGKTIQMCVFLRAIAESRQESRVFEHRGLGPTLIVCPATIMHQWVRELNVWFPACRVAVLHSSGAHNGPKSQLIERIGAVRKDGSILITSYSTYAIDCKKLFKVDWHYVILDEGHKIRNPKAKVTMTIKELKTPHRLILSGSPMQNNLRELWSLVDFVYPGRLGSLKDFTERFSIPITQGGYANATTVQVRTAYKCACLLRDAISPYLLRRMKKDVQMVLHLPEKIEQILFCDLTVDQRNLYLEYLSSKTCGEILTGKMVPFVGLMHLRKLCNHPDLVTGGPNRLGDYDTVDRPELEFGATGRSGKMIVVQSLLRLWYKQKQKILLFSQSRQMLTILERFIIGEGYNFLRMDGTTPIAQRQDLVEKFNKDPDVFLFLLTTRVGGLGVNLTGANRVLIYDPDWNPSTDAQARERVWRIGQSRDVTIYRLLTSGTIEEKIYQRQIFKHFLTNRVLVDPKQQRFFKTNDLHELFTLGSSESDKRHGTETAAIFSATAIELNRRNVKLNKKDEKKREANEKRIDDHVVEKPGIKPVEENSIDKSDELGLDQQEDEKGTGEEAQLETSLSDETRQKLMEMAKKIARNFNKYAKKKDEIAPKKSHKKESLFDGKYEIPLLKKQKKVRERKEGGEELVDNKKQNDYVLSRLLGKGIHSALRHDQIVGENSRADIQLVEDEAESVAKRAADVLKRSRRIHKEFVQNAAFSSMKKKPLFGQKKANAFGQTLVNSSEENSHLTREESLEDSSGQEKALNAPFGGGELLKRQNGDCTGAGADLLKSIRLRKENMLEVVNCKKRDDGGDSSEVSDSDGDNIQNYPSLAARHQSEPFSLGDRYEHLADDIRCYLARNDGSVSTNDLLKQFKDKITPTDSFAFRSILKRLCRLLPNSRWVLRDEFA